jgi:hypothetical protein
MNPKEVVRLVRIIGVLALPAAAQTRCLELMGVAPLADELALELHDQVLLMDQFWKAATWAPRRPRYPAPARTARRDERPRERVTLDNRSARNEI